MNEDEATKIAAEMLVAAGKIDDAPNVGALLLIEDGRMSVVGTARVLDLASVNTREELEDWVEAFCTIGCVEKNGLAVYRKMQPPKDPAKGYTDEDPPVVLREAQYLHGMRLKS